MNATNHRSARAGEDPAPARVAGTKIRFVTLDGIRGVAALAVMCGHFMAYLPGHPFLYSWTAVDLFFILSGFVVAHAYEQKLLGGLTFAAFGRLRLLRLYPLYAIGLLAGILAYRIGGSWFTFSGFKFATASALGVLFLPYFGGRSMPLFPMNVPSWSLLDELAINGVYGLLAVRRRAMSALFCFGLTLVLAFHLLAWHRGSHGIMNGGWLESDCWQGFVRVAYGFPLGVLLYRWRGRLTLPSFPGWIFAAIALLAMDAPARWHPGIYTAVLSLCVWPALIAFGSMAAVGRAAGRVLGWLGGISYALYVVHIPIGIFLGRWLDPHQPVSVAIDGAVAVAAADVLTRYVEPRLRALLGRIWSPPGRIA